MFKVSFYSIQDVQDIVFEYIQHKYQRLDGSDISLQTSNIIYNYTVSIS